MTSLVFNKRVICGEILDFVDDPAKAGEQAHRYFEQGALVIVDGKITGLGNQSDILPALTGDYEIRHYQDSIIIPGMIDSHIHFPQTEMIAAYGEQLLEWLEEYAFPTEKRFADENYAAEVANRFLDELLRNGTTTALVFGTVHPQSVEAFFSQAQRRKLRMIAGKVLMDRNCPDDLSDTPEDAYEQSKTLINKWHGVDRLSYAITPRFAPTSSPQQLESCKRLLNEFNDVYVHTHLSENIDECEWVKALFPEAKDYLGVYEDAGLVKKRSVFAHGIHVNIRELTCLADNQASLAHCPTSNLFLGSGLFKLKTCEKHGVNVGMGTDVGAGTSFSMLQTAHEAYKIQQLQGEKFSAFKGFYLATLGGAKALDLKGTIGNFDVGCEADFVVLDYRATPLLEFRMKEVSSLHEKLFAIMMLGDDRCVSETMVLGETVYKRDAEQQFMELR